MVLTVVLPKKVQEKLERDKLKTGLSKSYIVRQILMSHYKLTHEQTKGAA